MSEEAVDELRFVRNNYYKVLGELTEKRTDDLELLNISDHFPNSSHTILDSLTDRERLVLSGSIPEPERNVLFGSIPEPKRYGISERKEFNIKLKYYFGEHLKGLDMDYGLGLRK